MKSRWEQGTVKDFDKGAQDFVKVIIRKEGESDFKPFLSRRTPLRLNGHSVTLFGRTDRGGRDRTVEAGEIILRQMSDLETICDCDANAVCTRMAARKKAPDVGSVRRKIAEKIAEHPCVKIDEVEFTKVASRHT